LPLVGELFLKAVKREFGSDLLGGIAIVTAVLLGEYLAGSIIVLMLSGGEALESYALRSASSVLAALAKRVPSIAHRKTSERITDVALADVQIGEILVIYPHDICPVDGEVIEGQGVMDESYLTGEPFQITKTIGSAVISGSINGDSALTIRTTKLAADSRYAKIMATTPKSWRSTGCDLYAYCTWCRGSRLGDQRRVASIFIGTSDRNTVPTVDCDSCRHYWFDFSLRAAIDYR
jgi:cation transport ATPase